MNRLKRVLGPWGICLAVLLVAGSALGLARSIWEFNPFALRNGATQASCQNNLKQAGLAIHMYFNESRGGDYPLLSDEANNIFFHWQELYPQFINDRDVFVCPGPAGDAPANTFTDKYYVYTGYFLRNQEDLDAFASAYTAEVAGDADFTENLPGPSSYGEEVYRLKDGIERFFITDINDPSGYYKIRSETPVMWEWPDNHDAGHGANVLYLDGHVEWVNYGEKFPVTEEATATLAALALYTPPTDWGENGEYVSDYATISPFPSKCINNMKQIGLVNAMFSNESAGEAFPPLSSEGGRLMCDAESVHPEYINDPIVYNCPGRVASEPTAHFDDKDYVYLGYLMMTDGDVQQFATAYNQTIGAGGDFTGDLTISTSYGPTMYRIRDGVEEFVEIEITEPTQDQITTSDIPVLLEWPENHEGNSGGHVLFMSGRVEWMPYPGEFPMTETTITTLRALAQNTPATTWAVEPPRPEPYLYIGECNNILRQWGLVDRMYSNESQGQFWPPLSLTPGELAPRDAEVYPEYVADRYLGACPGAEDEGEVEHFDDRHYVYLGYAMLNDSDMQQFATAYSAEIAAGGDFSEDLVISSSYGDSLLRLKENVESSIVIDNGNPIYLTAARRDIPVMIEWPGNHEGQTGGNVLYLDGHVEWHDYPGEFPMTEATITALDSIADWTPTTAWTVPRFPGPHDEYDHALCAGNEKQFGYSFKIYANGAEGEFYPPLSTTAGNLMTEDARFLRYYLRDTRRMNCPGSPNAYRQPTVADHSYAYLGYLVYNQETLEQFATAYQQQAAGGGDFTEDLVLGEETIPRLREGIERFLITDIHDPGLSFPSQRNIPVLVEWPDNHGQIRGGNVLYMDGRVEWLDYPSTFPMTEEAMDILTALAGRGPIRPAAPPRESTRLEALSGG